MSEAPGADTLEPTPGQRLIEGAKEALAIARGEIPAARITINGHAYVPEAEAASLRAEKEELREAIRRVREILIASHSLPHDWTIVQVADAIVEDVVELRFKVRATCRRAEAAESLLVEAGKVRDELIAALKQAGRRFRNCRGAIESGQVVDKDVHGSLSRGLDEVLAAIVSHTKDTVHD